MINRRELMGWVTAVTSLPLLPALAAEPHPEIAFTFDDPKTTPLAGMSWQQINERILATLARRKLQAMLFVCGMRVDSEDGRALVKAWDRLGHLIGNHSYSHPNIDNQPLERFEADLLKNEPLITSYGHFTPVVPLPVLQGRQHGGEAGRNARLPRGTRLPHRTSYGRCVRLGDLRAPGKTGQG